MSANNRAWKRAAVILLSIIVIGAAIGLAVYFTLRETGVKSTPQIVFAQDDITATVGETKMLHASVQLPDGTIVTDGLTFSSSNTAVLLFDDENIGVFRVLDITDPPEKVEVTVSAPAYSVKSVVAVSIMRYSNKLHLNYNGATTSGDDSVNVHYLHRINDLPTPEKLNYTFVGWFAADNVKYGNGDMFMLQSDVSLTAKFVTTLRLDCENGQTLGVSGVEYNGPLPGLANPKKSGWTFDGWYTERGGAGKKYEKDDIYTESEPRLYAKWTREISLISELDQSADTVSVVYAAAVQISDPDYSAYEGAVFGGWYTGRGGSGEAFSAGDVYLFDYAEALYACVMSEVTFDGNDADSLGTTERFYIPLGGTYGRLGGLPTPVKAGWSFDGWYTAEYGDGDRVTDDTAYAEFKSNVVLHASWRSELRFETELGKSSAANVVYGKPVTPPAMSAQYGWSFDGWYSQPYCGGEALSATESYKDEGSRTLYGGWKKNIKAVYPSPQTGRDTETTLEGVIFGLALAKQGKSLPAVSVPDGLVALWSISGNRESADLVDSDAPLPKEASVLYMLRGLPGAGSDENPYAISNSTALELFADSVNAEEKIYNTLGVCIKVTKSFSMSKSWSTPIADNNWEEYFSTTSAAVNRRFVGTFDGGNNTIYDLTVVVPSSARRVDTYVGLFGYIGKGGIVCNVKLNNVSIDGASVRDNANTTKGGANNGGIAGLNSGTVYNCSVSGTVTGTAALDTQIGGIVGYMFEVGASVENCVNTAAIGGTAGRCTSHGGILGSVNNGHIKNCTNRGNISGVNKNEYHYNSSEGNRGYQFYGGISGVCCAVIEGCVNYGSVQKGYVASFGEVGGAEIVGYLHDGSDANISTNSNQSLYIDSSSGIKYSNTYYYSGVIDCSTANSGKNLLGFVQNDHGKIAVTSGYNNKTNAYSGNRAVSLSGNYNIMYLTVDDVSVARALICSLTEITDIKSPNLPGWGIALIVVGAALLIAAAAITTVVLVRKRGRRGDSDVDNAA